MWIQAFKHTSQGHAWSYLPSLWVPEVFDASLRRSSVSTGWGYVGIGFAGGNPDVKDETSQELRNEMATIDCLICFISSCIKKDHRIQNLLVPLLKPVWNQFKGGFASWDLHTTLGFRQGLLLLALGGVCLGAQSSPCKHSDLAQRNHTTFPSLCRDMTCIDAMQFEFMQLDEPQLTSFVQNPIFVPWAGGFVDSGWVWLGPRGVPLRTAAVGRTLQHQLVQVPCFWQMLQFSVFWSRKSCHCRRWSTAPTPRPNVSSHPTVSTVSFARSLPMNSCLKHANTSILMEQVIIAQDECWISHKNTASLKSKSY